MRRAAFLIGAALVIVPALRASADEDATAMDFRDLCNAKTGSAPDWFCSGYIIGEMQGLAIAQGHDARLGIRTTCLPETATGRQVRLIVEKYMRDHPEKLNELPSTLIANALEEAFPCPAR